MESARARHRSGLVSGTRAQSGIERQDGRASYTRTKPVVEETRFAEAAKKKADANADPDAEGFVDALHLFVFFLKAWPQQRQWVRC